MKRQKKFANRVFSIDYKGFFVQLYPKWGICRGRDGASHHLRPNSGRRKKKERMTVRAEKKRTLPFFVPKTMNDLKVSALLLGVLLQTFHLYNR